MDLRILNIGIDQSIPTGAVQQTTPAMSGAASATASVKARAVGSPDTHGAALEARNIVMARAEDVNQTVATISAKSPYNITVKVPTGRYYISGVMSDPARTSAYSGVFSVVEGNTTSCLSDKSATTSASASGTGAGSTKAAGATTSSSPSSSASSAAGSSESDSKSIGGGAIAGIVIGVLAGIAILGLLAVCCLRRRRQAREDGEMYPQGGVAGQPPSKHFTRHPHGSDGGHIALTSFASSDEHEKDLATSGNYPQAAPVPAGYPVVSSWRPSDPFSTAPNTPVAEQYAYTPSAPAADTQTQGQEQHQHRHQPQETLAEKRSSLPYMDADMPVVPAAATTAPQHPQQAKVVRSTSTTRRKPVPSLGPELRGQMERKKEASEPLPNPNGSAQRRSFALIPDKPLEG